MNSGNSYIINQDVLIKCEPYPGPVVATIPDGVRTIKAGAFQDCSDIVEYHFPESANFIPIGVFFNCRETTVIHLPDSIIIERAGSFFGEGVEPVKLNAASFFQYTIAPAVCLKKVIAKKITAKNVDELFLTPAKAAKDEKIVAYPENWKAQAASKKRK